MSRVKIETDVKGSHLILQARDVDGVNLSLRLENPVRFNPHLSPSDWVLRNGDVMFMARGFRNFSVLIKEIPDNVLAAACFFIVRPRTEKVIPEYLSWYLNQPPVERYLQRHIGRGVNMPVVQRAVLEGVDVPLPPLEIQRKVADLNELMGREMDLVVRLAEKRKMLIAGACLKAVEGTRE